MPEGSAGRIEVRRQGARPRLTLVSRDGDPFPAVVIAVATDLGPAATSALAAVVETRVRAAGFELDTRVDRSAFRLRVAGVTDSRLPALFAAAAASFNAPVEPGTAELRAAAASVAALRRNPLDAPELSPLAACTGRLGVASTEPLPDLSGPEGAKQVERWRVAALGSERTSVAAVGPAPYGAAAAAAFDSTSGWPSVTHAADSWPTTDSMGAYAVAGMDRRAARVSLAVRVGDAAGAVAAAERLGATGAPLHARVASRIHPWRVTEVAGVARPLGGCVSVVLETAQHPSALPVEASAAEVLAIARQELALALQGPNDGVAERRILSAEDPRDAASLAGWWALSGSIDDRPPRTFIALGLPPGADGRAPTAALKRFQAETDRALASTSQKVTERRLAVERGQGELWLLLATPCGVAEEGAQDAGTTALAALAAVHGARASAGSVALEPWITPDGLGVLAHAPLGPGETPEGLARRVADAAARVLAASSIPAESLAAARSAALGRIERVHGRQGIVFGRLADALLPGHPSWLDPFGVWERVAGGSPETVRLRWSSVAAGPLRLSVIANVDSDQAEAAASAVDRWLVPRSQSQGCTWPPAPAPRPGRLEARLPRETVLAQVTIGASIPPDPEGLTMARFAAAALDGPDGLLGTALPLTQTSARVVGGSRAAALIVDVKAPPDQLAEATSQALALLARLGQVGAAEADLARAGKRIAQQERETPASPRRRLLDLWMKRPPSGARPPALAAWQAWLRATLRQESLVVVSARPE